VIVWGLLLKWDSHDRCQLLGVQGHVPPYNYIVVATPAIIGQLLTTLCLVVVKFFKKMHLKTADQKQTKFLSTHPRFASKISKFSRPTPLDLRGSRAGRGNPHSPNQPPLVTKLSPSAPSTIFSPTLHM